MKKFRLNLTSVWLQFYFGKLKILNWNTFLCLKTKQVSCHPINISHEYFSLAAVVQIPALSLNTGDKWLFDSQGQYHWSNKYVWRQSQRRNNWPTYAGAINKLQVCLAGKQTHVQDIPGSCFALSMSILCGTASHSDKRPSSTLVTSLLFVFPRRKSLIQIVSARGLTMDTVKLAKVPEKCVRAQDGDSLQTVISPNVSICRGNGLLYAMDVA